MSHPYSFQRQFGQEWSKPINTSEIFLTMMNDLSFLYTLVQERDVLRSNERIRRDVWECTMVWNLWSSSWMWSVLGQLTAPSEANGDDFSLDCNAKGLYWIALPSISQGQTGLSYMGARHQKLATGAWAWFLRSNRRWRGCQWVSRKSLGALSHN